jgi:hypothetical protein
MVILDEPPRVLSTQGFPAEVLEQLRETLLTDGDADSLESTVQSGCFSHMHALTMLPLCHHGITRAILCTYMHRGNTALSPQASYVPPAAATRPASSPAGSETLRALAHDVRTPITVIRGYLKMLIEGRQGPLTDGQRQCIETALESTNRMAEIVSAAQGLRSDQPPNATGNRCSNRP